MKTAKVGHIVPKIDWVRIGPGSERVNEIIVVRIKFSNVQDFTFRSIESELRYFASHLFVGSRYFPQ